MSDTGGRNDVRASGREIDSPGATPVRLETASEPVASEEQPATPATREPGAATALTGSASVDLGSLAPNFERDQHDTYLRRLNRAIKDDKNRNIALTGRYGAGKSSVLNEFQKSSGAATLRLAISSLGPDEEGASLTNRIQKELVKQLVYSAAPATLRHSRFVRSEVLSWKRAAGEVTLSVIVLGALLAMLGWLPPVVGTGPDEPLALRVLCWVLATVPLVVIATFLRLVVHDRFQVAGFSAAGATISLSKPEHTYFDEYLDDIVNYFDYEDVDVVIFEDLDRFDDPHIFEALRELNTLLNKTQKRQRKSPLRFVYAVRDSLFELIGNDATPRAEVEPQSEPQSEAKGDPRSGLRIESDDLAVAEAIRANRTKFFDIVIPMVPFISHRNARELLDDLLTNAGVYGVERPLVSLIARYATDMRLLRNIVNEYLVFSERLLESEKVAPGLTASNLFALVAYKNFHLADFENIARRASVLDRLYDYRRELVRSSIERLEGEKRALVSGRRREISRAPLAAKLGERLQGASRVAHALSRFASYSHLTWRVGSDLFTVEEVSRYRFWAAVASVGSVEVLAAPNADAGPQTVCIINKTELTLLAPEALEADRWADIDDQRIKSQIAAIDRNIEFLRGSNFDDLASASDFKLSLLRTSDGSLRLPPGESDLTSDSSGEVVECTFRQLIVETLLSELGRELVLRGYLERNFALYAAQFYGHFTGVDVANFIVQNVQANTMEVQYPFDAPESVANLLSEADADFTHTIAAYNIEVLNYLLDNKDPRAVTIIHHVADDASNPAAKSFLTAYLTSSTARREQFVAHLTAKPWRDMFKHLAENSEIPEDARPSLFSAALCAATEPQDYDLPIAVMDYISEHYLEMAAFVDPLVGRSAAVVGILAEAGAQLPTVRNLRRDILDLVVAGQHYALTADNLHAAVGDPQVEETHHEGADANQHAEASGELKSPEDGGATELSLDRLRGNEDVYRYILASPDAYFSAVDDDSRTLTTVRSASVLTAVLTDIQAAETWSEEQVRGLIVRSAPSSRLDDITSVPPSAWKTLAAAHRFRATLRNVNAYYSKASTIDGYLAALLELAGEIDASEGRDSTTADGNQVDRVDVALAVLNCSEIADPRDRVKLAVSIGAPMPLPVAGIDANHGDLLALLLREGLVEDTANTFQHFRSSGWAAIGPGIKESTNVAEFVTPALIEGMVADVLRDSSASSKLGRHIVEDAATYVPDSDDDALREAGLYARSEGIPLPIETIRRVATAASNEDDQRVVLELLRDASPTASTEDIVEVFKALGHPYALVAQPGETFDMEKDDLNQEILNRLDGRVNFRKRSRSEVYKVTVL